MKNHKQDQPTTPATPAATTPKPKANHRMTESELASLYPGIVPGSLVWDEAANKQTVERTLACGHTHRLATSDCWQVTACPSCRRSVLAARRKAKRAARKAARLATTGAAQ